MKVTCTICGGSHPKWDCTKPQKESTAARKDVPAVRELVMVGSEMAAQPDPSLYNSSRSQALPVDTPHKPKIGRPKTDFDRTEYQKLYMRDKATIKRLGLTCTVKEYRESLK